MPNSVMIFGPAMDMIVVEVVITLNANISRQE
jgi:hypothetical protein